jgi:uncharacterized SAM-binding protein YcdF (DUF218 family)
MRRFLFFLALLLALAGCVLGSGRFLVRDNAEKSDAIVVLAGDRTNSRYLKGLEMLRAGYGKVMLVDAQEDFLFYGHSPAEYAERYIKESAGADADRVKVCKCQGDGTRIETRWVTQCMEQVGAKSGLIVTSDFHTRRALSVFQTVRPQYRWTVTPSHDPSIFGVRWWQNREWAKTLVGEWERTLWWNFIDRWRK